MRKKVWIGFGILAFAVGLFFSPKLTFQRLAQPEFLWGLGLLLPMLWGFHYQQRKHKARLQRLYDSRLHQRLFQAPSPPWQKQLPLVIMFACVIMALARPQGPLVMSDGTRNGIDILIGIDVSDSMKATDEGYPNRMGGATSIVQQLTPFIDGDRVGLFVFSGEAFSLAPFTYDHSTLQTFVEEVSPTLLPSATTDLEEGLKHALRRFGIQSDSKVPERKESADKAGQMLLLFSDGENQLGDYRDELAVLAQHKIPVITIGVGTAEGARIPEESLMGRSYKLWQGDYAVTKLNAKTLTSIAESTNGSYLPLKNINRLPDILAKTRNQLQLRTSDQKTQQFEERYVYWLALGALCWLLWPLVFTQWRAFSKREPRQRFAPFSDILKRTLKSKPAQGLPMALIALLLSPLLQSAWSWNPMGWRPFWQNSQGEQAYESKNYEEAAKAFEKGLNNAPDNPALKNNEGHAQYQSQNYDKAIENYQGNLEAPQLSTEQKANTLYNLGNSYYRKGQSNPAEQKKNWQAALEAYQKALKLNPQDEQAMENLNFVQQQLKQQEQQQNKGQNDKNDPQQEKKPGDKPDAQPSPNDSQQPGKPQQNPGEAPENVPTPEPSPQYFDKTEVDQFLKQQELEERQSKGNFHRSRQKQKEAEQNKNGDPWNQTVKNW